MSNAYQDSLASQSYENFLGSEYGQEFRRILGHNFLKLIQTKDGHSLSVLDAGCGDGWLAGLLSNQLGSASVAAFDLSEILIKKGQTLYPQVQFQVADLVTPLPYEPACFDYITASMVLHDVDNETLALKNLALCLKPEGQILASIVNPYYGFPVGVWKRGLIGRLLNRLPRLRLAEAYNQLKNNHPARFSWRDRLFSNFTPLEKHFESFKQSGLYLDTLLELGSPQDSDKFNLSYQLHRYPIILLLVLKKLRK